MLLIILFGLLFLFMLIEDNNIKKDIDLSSKSSFTKMDAEYYYKNFKMLNLNKK